MVGGLTQFGSNYVLDRFLGSEDPLSVFIGLTGVEPNVETTGSETAEPFSAPSYERVEVPNDVVRWPAAENGQKRNGVDIDFAMPDEDWGMMRYALLLDSDEDGNLIAWAQLTTSRFVVAGKRPWFAAGMLAFNAFSPD
jgi:hypothetical protein